MEGGCLKYWRQRRLESFHPPARPPCEAPMKTGRVHGYVQSIHRKKDSPIGLRIFGLDKRHPVRIARATSPF